MKKLYSILFTCLLLISCSDKESDIKNATSKAVKDHLFYPDSYDPIGFQIDSAFVNILTPQNFRKAERLHEISHSLEYDNKNTEEFTQLAYEIANDYVNQRDRHEFIGYGVTHRYRAQNGVGQIGIIECVIIFDKDIENIIGYYGDEDIKSRIPIKVLYEIIDEADSIVSGKYDILTLADKISRKQVI